MLFAIAFLAGVLAVSSPCILPVLPFVLARADRPFLRNGLPMLVGMALTFAIFAAVAGGWIVEANRWGRFLALALLNPVRAGAAASRHGRAAASAHHRPGSLDRWRTMAR